MYQEKSWYTDSSFGYTSAGILDRKRAAASVNRNGGRILSCDLDTKNDRAIYEVSVLEPTGDVMNYEIDALTGALLDSSTGFKSDKDIEILSRARLTHENAADAVMEKVSDGRIIESELTVKKKQPVYEITMVDEHGLQYEARVNAIDGSVMSLKKESRIKDLPAVSRLRAEEAALSSVPGTVLYTKAESPLFRDPYYMVRIIQGDKLYDVKVDGMNGEVKKANEK